jgi:hypothetical protein
MVFTCELGRRAQPDENVAPLVNGRRFQRLSQETHRVPLYRHLFVNSDKTEHNRSMISTSPLPHALQTLGMAHDRTLLRASDLQEAGIPRVVLARLVAAGHLERVGRGLYRLPGAAVTEHETLVTVARRVPQAVFCLLTALQYHGLTTQLPREVWIAMPRGSHLPRLDFPPLHMVQCAPEVQRIGVESFVHGQVEIHVHGVARTVIDCFKFRNQIGLDVAIEALKGALAEKKVTVDDLWHFGAMRRVTNVMRPYLEAVL